MSKVRLTLLLGSFTTGGGQRVVYELLKKIDYTKIEVQVICYEGRANHKIESEIEQFCSVLYLDAKGKITFSKIKKVFAALRATRPDVIHVHLGGMVYAVPWALLHNVPLLITAHTKPEKAFERTVLPLIKWGVYRKKIKIAAVSQENCILMRRFFGIDDDRIVCVNNGIDIERYYSCDHEGFVFINVARQDENKNQAAIIRCFAKIYENNHDSKLLLVGDGPTHEALKQIAVEIGVEGAVDFTGMVLDPVKYYAVSDVYVQASHREAMPMSVLEAMAAKLPIISTDVGGLRDVVKGNGLLISDADENQLYMAMLELIAASDKKRYAMGSESWEIVQGYSSQNMAKKYESIYLTMLRARWHHMSKEA